MYSTNFSALDLIQLRKQAFGSNAIQKPAKKGLLEIMLETFKDPIIAVLLLSALFALGFGIKAVGLKGASDGLFILFSIFAVVAATSFSKIWPERQFHKSSKANNDISTIVIRDGKEQQILVKDVVVGDVVCLQTGYHFAFLLAGSKVTNGSARMLVTAVGENTKWGEMSKSTRATNDRTPLQMKLQKLTQNTAKVGVAIASMVLVVLLIRYYSGIMKDDSGTVDYYSNKKSVIHVWRSIIGILATSIVIASTAIPEGLLLAATVALAYSTKRMVAENVLVRNLSAFEAIGSITVISGSSSESNELQTEKTVRDWAVQELRMDIGKLKQNCSMLDPKSLNIQKKQSSVYIQRNNDSNTHIHMRGSADMILPRCSHYLIGVLALEDVPRPGIREVLKQCHQAKIGV